MLVAHHNTNVGAASRRLKVIGNSIKWLAKLSFTIVKF